MFLGHWYTDYNKFKSFRNSFSFIIISAFRYSFVFFLNYDTHKNKLFL